ncbi:MAG TPA: DUF2790 domain-containing protein [Pseudomonas sp.]|uniref:DUF2790 domain-containing protein n=1 Tax=Pseudomonas sp. TaxID=306 RepID=UPI002EDAD3BD
MKYLMFAALSLFSVFASANENVNGATDEAQAVPQAVEYDYSQKLDIAKVISMTSANDTANVCGVVAAHMIYVDSKGATHNLEYTRMGDGCQNG